MNVGFTFSVVSLFYSILLTIIFFSKERLITLENKVYSWAIIANLIGIILAISSYFLILRVDELPIINIIIAKGYLIYLLSYISILTLYVLLISSNKLKEEKSNYFDKCFNIVFILLLIFSFIIIVLPIYFYHKGNVVYTYGPSANVVYLISLIYIFVWIIFMLRQYQHLKSKKYLPLFSFISIGTVVMIIQKLNPGLLLMTAMETFVTFLMYFTIENPDIKMIDELTKAKTLVEKNNNDKSIFIFNTTQQIRNPLNMIEQKTEQILDYNLEEEVKEKILDIRTCEQRISYILRGVMDVSTIDAKNIKIVNNQYKIGNILTEIKIRAKKEAEKKGLEFRTSIDEGMPEELYGDSIRLKQIINGIVSNAIKYTDKGFVELDVNSIVSFDICRLIISVKDSGIGVNADKINKLFQSKEDIELDKVEGSDITLEVAKKMINLIGGTITVRSEKGRGSEFTIIVDQKIKTEENKIKDIVDEYKNLNNKKKIMIVTDNEKDKEIYNRFFSKNVILEIAENGEVCLNKIRSGENYDLILINEKLKKLEAYQIINKLKKLKIQNNKVIILTDNKDKEKDLITAGYLALSKDYTKDKFMKKINGFLDINKGL